ncbi:MAG: hypothetical protein EA421_03510 [Gemmatimonadales bacterium]|nr:MAG: hypothetical protein EA421_03510 [Gemmatimonadales bacterium]
MRGFSRLLLPRALMVGARALMAGALALAMSAGCGNGEAPPDALPGAPEEGVDPSEGIHFRVGIDQGTYDPGETIRVRMEVANVLEEERALFFRTGQRYDLIFLTPEGEEIHRWSEDRSFTQALGMEELRPGSEPLVWEESLQAPSVPGSYRLEAVVVADWMDLRATVPVEVSGG